MTDNEIIKALECCCLIDPKTIFLRDDKTGEITTLNMNDIFYLITRQQAKIERLKTQINDKYTECDEMDIREQL